MRGANKEGGNSPFCPYDFMKDCRDECPNQSISWIIMNNAIRMYSVMTNPYNFDPQSTPLSVKEFKDRARSGMSDLERKEFQNIYRIAMKKNYPDMEERCANTDRLEQTGKG